MTALFGDSPSGLRVASTLIGAATVVVAALAAREFGGGRGAQLLTAAATALSAYVLQWALVQDAPPSTKPITSGPIAMPPPPLAPQTPVARAGPSPQ